MILTDFVLTSIYIGEKILGQELEHLQIRYHMEKTKIKTRMLIKLTMSFIKDLRDALSLYINRLDHFSIRLITNYAYYILLKNLNNFY